jgi:hypothetical protein
MYKIQLYLGLGDIILTKSYLLNILKNQTVTVSLSDAVIASYIRNPKKVDFTYDFLKTVYYENGFTISKEVSKERPINWHQLRGKYQENILDLAPTLAPYEVQYSNYICVNTKIRDLHYNQFLNHLPNLKNALIQLSKKYKIILMGEKEVEQTIEYSKLKNLVYSMYTHIKDIDCIDLTVDKLGDTETNLEKLKYDASLMKNAICTINIGAGGNLSISSSVGKSINYMQNTVFFKHDFLHFKDNVYKNCIVHKDFNLFIRELLRL